MSSRAFIPLIIGFGVGLLALKMGYDYIKKAEGASANSGYTEILICNADIPMTVEIMPEMIGVAEMPTAVLPAQYFPADQREQVIGRVASVMLSRGMPLSPLSLAAPGTPPGLVVRIPNGLRAIAVKVAEEQQAGGWIVPGAKVDVSAVFSVNRPGARRMETVSRVILQDVEVAAVGQSLGNESEEGGAKVVKSVTLLVKPADVPKLHLAQTKGKLTFAVRGHRDDSQDGQNASSSESELVDGQNAPEIEVSEPAIQVVKVAQAEPASVSAPFRVEIVNGDSREFKVYENEDSLKAIPSEGPGRPNPAQGGSAGYHPEASGSPQVWPVQMEAPAGRVEEFTPQSFGFPGGNPE
jgi:pilus assembly protein CpaB